MKDVRKWVQRNVVMLLRKKKLYKDKGTTLTHIWDSDFKNDAEKNYFRFNQTTIRTFARSPFTRIDIFDEQFSAI